jgi:hypothetical protein
MSAFQFVQILRLDRPAEFSEIHYQSERDGGYDHLNNNDRYDKRLAYRSVIKARPVNDKRESGGPRHYLKADDHADKLAREDETEKTQRENEDSDGDVDVHGGCSSRHYCLSFVSKKVRMPSDAVKTSMT